MRKISKNFLLVVGIMVVLGMVQTAFANDVITKIPKNMSVISVTTDEPMSVYVDGVEVGRTQGNQIKFERTVTPGIHEVKIVGAEGKEFTKTYTFNKGVRNCVCLKTVTTVKEDPCPYNVTVTGPERVTQGDLITFAALNSGAATALNYVWKVSPAGARITSGLGTPSITVDTADLGGQTVSAEVDVTDGVYDAQCRQRIAVSTLVDKYIPPPIDPPTNRLFETIVFRVFDDDKARLDNYAVELQNKPDAQGYVIVYQGPKVKGKKFVDADKMAKRSLDYLVKVRGIDPRRIVVTNGGTREETMGDLWLVPPGAQPPVPSPR